MTTFFLSFEVIERVLPTLYRRQLVADYDGLMRELERELIAQVRGGLHVELAFEEAWVDEVLEHFDISEIVMRYEAHCDHLFAEWWWIIPHLEVVVYTDDSEMCVALLTELAETAYLVEEVTFWTDVAATEDVQWFNLRQLRDHAELYGSHAFRIVEDIIYEFATLNNVRVIIWEIEPITREVGEVLIEIEGRGTEQDFMTTLGVSEAAVRQQNFYHPTTGGFAIAVSGTFQPAYRVLTIISGLQRQLLLIMIFISVSVAFLFSRYLARPIMQLSTESKKLRELKFSEEVAIKRNDEIGELSSNLNFMSFELKKALDELQSANEKLKEEMAREREQERQRRNLFTSISHELKTPLTILKGEIGGMIDGVGAYKDRDAYLASVYGWTETLEKLVGEILTISRLEGEKMNLDLAPTDISALIEEICEIHQALADSQHVRFNKALDAELTVHADAPQLQIALSNVINNAVFYSQPGEMVNVRLKQEKNVATLVVTNTGAHIEKADLNHLFDPFYRVDKSRNRHTGGSGLGLFIVKNILELHGFTYTLENVEEGVRFTINMPVV